MARWSVRPTLKERFDKKFERITESGCWIWLGATRKDGYGAISLGWYNNKPNLAMAHRVAYELYKGPIPEGLEIDHICCVTCCVNPDHLRPVTRQFNITRGNAMSARHARKTHCPRGHEYSPSKIHVTLADGKRHLRVWRRCMPCTNVINAKSKRKRDAERAAGLP